LDDPQALVIRARMGHVRKTDIRFIGRTLERAVERAEMVWAVRGLPDRQREVVVLRFFLDRSVAETARLLATSEGTVKSHTDRALKRLRERLSDSGRSSVRAKEVSDAH
jgi:DNA-directed RNA polymerase specialized sigma24 family protein